ncbi:MAG: hypothetical protein KJ067_05380 [Vicinamibacteria bacterium]|nr:hypothetical protein [Vicinamibacteria bacterium]
MPSERRAWLVAALAASVAALLPFARPLLSGESLYFRDLGLIFFPLRRLALDGLARGEITWWNPYVHEGAPLPIPALSYPLDLLQLLWPAEPGLSASLMLHVPLSALAFLGLARSLGLTPLAGGGGALVYALGGFALSTLNTYIYVQALAWAPLVVLTLGRAVAVGRLRDVGFAALATAMLVSTTAAEFGLQAMLLAVVLGLPAARLPRCWPAELAARAGDTGRGLARAALALALAAALTAPVLVAFRAQLEGTERGSGFATAVVLAHSIHPLSAVQTLVSGFYFDPADVANRYWGHNFFSRGFPYFLSLYLGPLVVGLAAGGAALRGKWLAEPERGLRLRLLLVMPLLAVAALGTYSGLAPLVDRLPLLHAFRYPQKLFFGLHLGVALLAALGLEAVGRGRSRPLVAGLGLGLPLLLAPLLPTLFPGAVAWFARGFFPPGLGAAASDDSLHFVLGDAAAGGGLSVLAAAGALLLQRRLRAAAAALLLATAVGADLLRASGALNATVTPAFFRLSPEGEALAAALRGSGSRLFTCDVHGSPAYRAFRRAHRGRHELATFTLLRESFTPNYNVDARVPTALSLDLTMMVPGERVASPEESLCRDLDALLPRLRAAGVGHVASLDPLAHPELRGVVRVPLRGLDGLALAVHRVEPPPPPLIEVEGGELLGHEERPGRLAARVAAPGPARLIVRQAWARGWRATVDGAPATVDRHAGRHLSVSVAGGRHEVRLAYEPAGLGPAMALAALAALAVAGLVARRRERFANAGAGRGPAC